MYYENSLHKALLELFPSIGLLEFKFHRASSRPLIPSLPHSEIHFIFTIFRIFLEKIQQ